MIDTDDRRRHRGVGEVSTRDSDVRGAITSDQVWASGYLAGRVAEQRASRADLASLVAAARAVVDAQNAGQKWDAMFALRAALEGDYPMNEPTEIPPTVANTGVLTHHDLSCQCWPHVSEQDALDAIAAAGLNEYRDGKAAERQARAAARLEAWAGSVRRLIAAAPISAVMEETGVRAVMEERGIGVGHSTPPERQAIRQEALRVVERWLERDLAAIEEAEHE